MFRYIEKYDCSKSGKKSFYSCPWIQHGLVFFRYKLANCCYCGHVGGGHTIIKDNYNGQKIEWERLARQKREYLRLARKGFIHENCTDCPLLTEMSENDLKSDELYINNLYISHWVDCNCRCTYCFAAQNPSEFQYKHRPYSVLPIIKEMLEKNILRRGGSIHFGGGEPTLLPEFEDIIRLLLDYKFYDLRVHTSGIRYSKILERGIREGRLRVIISVDAGCAETYRKIKQVPLYDVVRENAGRYASSQERMLHKLTPDLSFDGSIAVSTKFIVIPGVNDMEEEVENWIKADVEAGIKTTVIDLEENWFKEHEYNLPDSIFDFIYKIKLLSEKYGTHFELYERVSDMLKENPDRAPWYKNG